MADKCIYCGIILEDNRALSVCNICGQKVWGQKMFEAIRDNMNEAREKGDLVGSTTPPGPVSEEEAFGPLSSA